MNFRPEVATVQSTVAIKYRLQFDNLGHYYYSRAKYGINNNREDWNILQSIKKINTAHMFLYLNSKNNIRGENFLLLRYKL